MKIVILLIISILVYSCSGKRKVDNHKLILERNNIDKIEFKCADSTVNFNESQITYFIEKVNNAKNKGLIKGIVQNKIKIYLNNGDSINIRLLNKYIKWDKAGDWAYELQIENHFLETICN
jgi:hypothetical protein